MKLLRCAIAALVLSGATPVGAQSVFDATLAEPDQKTAEVSTAEIKEVIIRQSSVVLDARPPLEYAISHIPGALNVAPSRAAPLTFTFRTWPRSPVCWEERRAGR